MVSWWWLIVAFVAGALLVVPGLFALGDALGKLLKAVER